MKTITKFLLPLFLIILIGCAPVSSRFMKTRANGGTESLYSFKNELEKFGRSIPETSNTSILAYKNSDSKNCTETYARNLVDEYNKINKDHNLIFLQFYCANNVSSAYQSNPSDIIMVEVVYKSQEKSWKISSKEDLELHKKIFPNSEYYEVLRNSLIKNSLSKILNSDLTHSDRTEEVRKLESMMPELRDSIEQVIADGLLTSGKAFLDKAETEFQANFEGEKTQDIYWRNRDALQSWAISEYNRYDAFYPKGRFKDKFLNEISNVEKMKRENLIAKEEISSKNLAEKEKKAAEVRKTLSKNDIDRIKKEVTILATQYEISKKEGENLNNQGKELADRLNNMRSSDLKSQVREENGKVMARIMQSAIERNKMKKKLDSLYLLVPEMK